MTDLNRSARAMIGATGDRARIDAVRDFVEKVTFAPPQEILDMLHEIADEDWLAMPPWARNLAYRLACLQRPGDAALLREAPADLLCFGPDWDDIAHRMSAGADDLDGGDPAP